MFGLGRRNSIGAARQGPGSFLAALYSGRDGDFWRGDVENSNATALDTNATEIYGLIRGMTLTTRNANACPIKLNNGVQSLIIDYAGSFGGGGHNSFQGMFDAPLTGPLTIAIAMDAVSVITASFFSGTVTGEPQLNNTSGGDLIAYRGGGALDTTSNEPHGRHVFIFQFNGLSSKVHRDGVQIATGGTMPNTQAAAMLGVSLGSFWNTNNSSQIAMHSFAVMTGTLTADQVADLTTYMGETQGRAL